MSIVQCGALMLDRRGFLLLFLYFSSLFFLMLFSSKPVFGAYLSSLRYYEFLVMLQRASSGLLLCSTFAVLLA